MNIKNIPGFDVDLLSHDHRQADTLLICHAIYAQKSNLFNDCVVYFSDICISNSSTLQQPASKCHFFPHC